MLTVEVLRSVEIIPDPYTRAITYARLGEVLARKKDPLYKEAFLKAFDSLKYINDPELLLRATLAIGYHMGKAGIRAYYKVFLRAVQDSAVLSPPVRDEILALAVKYLISLGDLGQAVSLATEISDRKLAQTTFLLIVKAGSRLIQDSSLKAAYKLRKIKLAVEYITDEPYRSKALLELAKAFVAIGSYESALATIKEINSPEWAKIAFKELTFILSQKGVIDKFIDAFSELANEFNSRFGSDLVVELAEAFLLAGNPKLAVQMLHRLKDPAQVISKIALEVLEKNPAVIPGLLEALPDEEAVIVGKAVMDKILERPTKALENVVKAVARRVRAEPIWVKVARYYTLIGDIEAAKSIGLVLRDPKLRSIVLADVARSYLKQNRIEDAIDAALEVRDSKFVSLLVSEILVRSLSEGGA
ncbi:tetratricopeptide repeat protein [Thermococcus stetteri]|uniref:tetratricopeptide repeat protein n=1 Tax=Thermococcus stetteri TaxID=49900 RepID=UPI001AE1D938|nr:prenyltransferase [Thermococcus stetteri]MBP1910902.1 tetratricopeptide (TPR) repeat protein [Thermococcus stetteri]